MRRPLVAAMLVTGVLTASCSPSNDPAPADSAVEVVTSTSILADVASDIVGCGGGTTTALIPAGADPHDFAPSSDQVAQLVRADLVVVNGLGLEPGLQGGLDTAAADGARILAVGESIDPIPVEGADPDHADDHGTFDPHFWLDMKRMATAATTIGDALAETTGQDSYRSCAQQTADRILKAEEGVRAQLESVPAAQRVLVTDHEALGYLADAYGYDIVGTVIPAATTLAEPSSADLAALTAKIREERVPAIFSNAGQPTALADAVAAESGADVEVVPLYVESLGAPGSPADNYIGMMQENARLISEALGG